MTEKHIHIGDEQDAQEIFSKRIAESQDSELYALVSEKRIMEVLDKNKIPPTEDNECI